MKFKCLFKSIVRGDLVKPGEVLDLTKEECALDVVKQYFVPVDEAPAAETRKSAAGAVPAPAGKAVVAGLTRDQAIMKLQQSGARIKANITNSALAALYEQTFANAAEAAAPAQ